MKILSILPLLALPALVSAQKYLDDLQFVTRTDHLQRQGIKGSDMIMFLFDMKPRRTHIQFKDLTSRAEESRVYPLGFASGTPYADHGTFMAGILLANGGSNTGIDKRFVGMAPQADAVCMPNNEDRYYITGGSPYLAELSSFYIQKLLVSNHSYNLANPSLPFLPWLFGAYTPVSADIDRATTKYYGWLPVTSSGNNVAVNPSPFAPGLDKLGGGMKTAKNTLVVGGVLDVVRGSSKELLSAHIWENSSWGPTDDLRIKPDIMGYGDYIYSCSASSDNSYSFPEIGTSNSAANVSGSLLLLQQLIKRATGRYVWASTLKAVALHTADDITEAPASVGPDVFSGWGLLNISSASQVVYNKGGSSQIIQGELKQGAVDEYEFYSDGGTELRASLCWTDPEGLIPVLGVLNSPTPALTNNLDLGVQSQVSKQITFPYSLRTDNPDYHTIVTDRPNSRDNYERVDVKSPVKGKYTFSVSHKGNLEDRVNQKYSLIITGIGKKEEERACSDRNVQIREPIREGVVIGAFIGMNCAVNANRQPRDVPDDYFNAGMRNDGVFLEGSREVLLTNGFSASDGATFTGYIVPCEDAALTTASFNSVAVANQKEIVPKDSVVAKAGLGIGLKFYPNPAMNSLTVESYPIGLKAVKIYSIDGKIILDKNEVGRIIHLNISKFPAGVYIISVTKSDGTITKEKFIKE